MSNHEPDVGESPAGRRQLRRAVVGRSVREGVRLNRSTLTWIGALVVVLSQYGCSTVDVVGSHLLKGILKPDPTVVEATVKVAQDVNPDTRDRPSPIKVRFYLLSSPNVLQSTGFYELKDQDRELLSNDLRLREERVFHPGEEGAVELRIPAEEVTEDERIFLGVVAGYWDLDGAKWQTVEQVEVQETTKVIVEVGRSEVAIKPVKK